MASSRKPSPKKPAAPKPVNPKVKPKAAVPKRPAPRLAAVPKPAAKPRVEPRLDSKIRPPPPRRAVREEPVEQREIKPQKPVVDAEWQAQVREMMVQQRQRLLSVVQATQAQMAERQGDLPDVSDRASEGFEDELAVGLMAIEAAQLEDVNSAIERIDNGTYGVCVDCGRAIPRKRLEVLPFARRCLTCEGEAERRHQIAQSDEEEEEID